MTKSFLRHIRKAAQTSIFRRCSQSNRLKKKDEQKEGERARGIVREGGGKEGRGEVSKKEVCLK